MRWRKKAEWCSHRSARATFSVNYQLDEIQVLRDLFRQILNEPQKNPLIQQSDQWGKQSIKKIQTTADEVRQLLVGHTTNHITQE